jgi:glycine/D-amino acid oxidase-like deaminating enzyme
VKLPGVRVRAEADVAVVGSGLPATIVALELRRRGASVILTGGESMSEHGLGLALLGPGLPYRTVASAIGRGAAQLLWAAGCENHLRLRAFVDAAGSDLGFQARGSFTLARTRAEAEALAESEDMLRDDGFPGEFLDHYLLETHFDLKGFPAGYWAAGDAEVDLQALREAAGNAARAAGVVVRPGRVRGVSEESGGVRVELEAESLRCVAAVVASEGAAAELLPEVASRVRLGAAARVGFAPLPGAALPAAVRTGDGRVAWQATSAGVVLEETSGASPGEPSFIELAAHVPFEAASVRRSEETRELALDGLPLVGRLPGRPLAVACGFAGLAPGLAFAAARWVADALLRGVDPTPDALRAARAPHVFPDV